MTKSPGFLAHLRAGGVSMVLDSRNDQLPAILHWGADLGPLSNNQLTELAIAVTGPFGDSRIEAPGRVALLPSAADGWTGTPGIAGSRSGEDFSPALIVTETTAHDGPEATSIRYAASDAHAQLNATIEVGLSSAGIAELTVTLTNTSADRDYQLVGINPFLPVPDRADELLTFTGRYSRERTPQRSSFQVGTYTIASRKGKPGPESGYVMLAGEPGFSFESGQVWGVHLGWSGNQNLTAERSFHGSRLIGAAELLLAGEVTLAPGESYCAPKVYGSFGAGLNDLAGRFHQHLRARSNHPRADRPVVVNTWEALYFDQNEHDLVSLAEAAAAVGAERFVLDDGWFSGRRSDRSGLGDWWVDEDVWPNGLGALIEKVHGLGMDFGLWVEPEMVSLNSALAAAHPEWLFRAGDRQGQPSRNQYVLDLANPGAFEHVLTHLTDLLDRYPIASFKWDHNRPVVEAGHQPTGAPGVQQQTLATYRLMAALKAHQPSLEIESCSAGGGRLDLGIAEFTDRVWPSDCNDALERQAIQRWTALILPPELIGTHVGPETSHTTGRRHHLDFRAATAFWGNMGIEWDIRALQPEEQHRLTQWVALHKQFRHLLHTGRAVVADHADPAMWIHLVVAQDQREAVAGITAVQRSTTWPPGRFRLPGLSPGTTYRIEPLMATSEFLETTWTPAWFRSGTHLTGRMLAQVGLALPALLPERTQLIHLTAVDDPLVGTENALPT
ncbi:alpha-galactosidase [Nakamurella antarctica]|uniref:alpha-galactosidase n=1 Tax=Nakamurella antarctica TaxID=1902245 RepID=A0A3G8ZJ85_9ACTN|nr:alpha-galactosidase [Nakamurella antarctica]AZI56827.1 alpha-galactosidase [Nakamurella antarctica]